MILTPAEITALAAALAPLVAQELKRIEEQKFDAGFWVTLPEEEKKRRSREVLARAKQRKPAQTATK